MQGGELINAVWLTFQVSFPADSGAKSRNVVANRFYTNTDYQSLAKTLANLSSEVLSRSFVKFAALPLALAVRPLDGGSVECVLILKL